MSPWIYAAIGFVCGLVFLSLINSLRMAGASRTRQQLLDDARRDVENLRKTQELDFKEELLRRREDAEKDLNRLRDELREQEKKVDKREAFAEETLDQSRRKEKMLETTQQRLADRAKVGEAREKELDRLLKQEQEELFKISGLSREEATARLITQLQQTLQAEAGGVIIKHEQELKQNCERMAREIIGMAIQRYASTHTSESTVSAIDIPNDEVKGRIIGREGRNIRAFEKETGVDVTVDDTPGVVTISSFDTVRREVARQALARLIHDGRIHPQRIEDVVREVKRETEQQIVRYGKEAAEEAGVSGLHERLIAMMGRLHFRQSYSQNVLRHSIEVAHLTGMMAEQLGLDGKLARRCGFLHDIGKAADHEMEGGHPAIGADLLKRFGEKAEVVHAALGHHDDIRPEYLYTVLTAAADACSASRPGARRETLEKYIRRLEELEAVVCRFPGVNQVYAMQAGREVRVIVDPQSISDRGAAKLARDVAEAIEQQLTYPGEIKVTVMRETRAVGIAK